MKLCFETKNKILEDLIKCCNPENRQVREETWSEESPDPKIQIFSKKCRGGCPPLILL